MAASSIDAFVVTVEDTNPGGADRANRSLSYELSIQNDIRVLSTNTNGNSDIEGFLYTPDFPAGSPCINRTAPYIPQNATRGADIPDQIKKPQFIALAPWTAPECVLPLFAAVKNMVTAFIFYLPNSTLGMPPPISDPVWELGDGGSWKSKNKYPVYAISGPQGSSIMTQLGQYSGAIANVPNGSLLQQQQMVPTTARMYAIVELSESTSLPSLWAFLLIVLGIVLFLIGLTSGIMHLYQRRRRNALRRRIVNGEVDLERLGIKRLTVPQEAINMLPQFTYCPSEKDLLDRPRDHITALSDLPVKEFDTDTTTSNNAAINPPSADPPEPALPQQEEAQRPTSLQTRHPSPPPSTSNPTTFPTKIKSSSPPQPSYAQPTCPICLDDFTPHTTIVRSLPCHHIYHPECIDPFLLHNSSLCPVCKSKVLPKGYCPATITNAMVRRERQQRRNRDRVRRIRGEEAAAQMPVASLVEPEPRRGRLLAVQGRMASFHRQFGRAGRTSGGQHTSRVQISPPAAVEMRDMNGEAVATTSSARSGIVDSEAIPSTPLPPSAPSHLTADPRSERARRRASLLMRAQDPTADEEERDRWARLPKWRKAIKSVFPGF
ncbi:MAG: hypothetical protein LQ338_000802 [Usnochroma carphineum]|nr:MAG: hypothetical protein LQ338_000802 [Usnochroma carphineum]